MRQTLLSFIEQSSERGDETALLHYRGLRKIKWTYRHLAEVSYKIARELRERGINKGDRVIFWAENSPEWVAAFYGCLLQGVVVVPLDEQSHTDFAGRIQKQVNARLLFTSRNIRQAQNGAIPAIYLDDLSQVVGKHSATPVTDTDIRIDDLAEIIFTSGTTAEPKGVCLTHKNLLANLNPLEEEVRKYIRYERPFHPLRFLCLLPLSHIFGQFMGIFVPQILGGEVIFQSSMNPGEIILNIRRERISVAAVVPRQLEALREKIERDYSSRGRLEEFRGRFDRAEGKHFLRRWWVFRDLHLRFGLKFWAFVSGGAALDEDTEIFWQRLGFAVVQGYGMTETASLITVNHPLKLSRGSIGKTLPGQEIRIGADGEILVRGENVAAGYWRKGIEPLTGNEGWLETGDMAAVDDQGNLFYKGRKKDVIVTSAGLNIYPEDLEDALNRQPEVRLSCVIGLDGPQGPEPMAVLILKDLVSNPKDIIDRTNNTLNPGQHIRRWHIWPEPDFPRTATQKVRKMIVREAVLAGKSLTSASTTQTGTLASIISDISDSGLINDDRIAGQGAELNLDSLGRVELLSAIEDRYQIELDEAAITPMTTLNQLERMVQEGSSGEPAFAYPYPYWSRRRPITWLRRAAYYLLIVPFVNIMCRPKAVGRRNLDNLKGNALFISNHVSMVDPAMILFSLPSRFRHRLAIAMAGERLRGLRYSLEADNILSKFVEFIKYLLVVTVFNVFPMPQKSGFRRSFSFAGEAVDEGYNLLVFPEGRTTDDGKIKPFMAGIGLLTSKLDIPVVPVKIEGLFNLARERRYFARPGSVTVTFGEPIRFDSDADPAEIVKELENCVNSL